jgi:hypothetical protein
MALKIFGFALTKMLEVRMNWAHLVGPTICAKLRPMLF